MLQERCNNILFMWPGKKVRASDVRATPDRQISFELESLLFKAIESRFVSKCQFHAGWPDRLYANRLATREARKRKLVSTCS